MSNIVYKPWLNQVVEPVETTTKKANEDGGFDASTNSAIGKYQ